MTDTYYKKKTNDGNPFKTRLLDVFMVVFMCLLCVVVHDLIIQADYFKIKNIQIEGTDLLSTSEIEKISGMEKGQNIFSVSLGKVKEKIINHPYVAAAAVKRNLPGTVQIVVTEEKPLAFLHIQNADTYVINDKGLIFKIKDDADNENMPVVTGVKASEIPMDTEERGSNYADVTKALVRFKEKKGVIRYNWVKEIHTDRESGAYLLMCDGCGEGTAKEIRLGKGRVESKLKRLDEIVVYLKEKGIYDHVNRLDIRDVNRVVVGSERAFELPGEKKEA